MNRRKFLKACLSAGVAMNLENVRAVEFCESVPSLMSRKHRNGAGRHVSR